MSNSDEKTVEFAVLQEAWKQLHDHRLRWATDVRKQFIEEMESEVVKSAFLDARSIERREVVVIGRSQVGKTTLILHLQGVVDNESKDRLERVLRGGREQGNSATSTATTFAVAPGSKFRIQCPWDDRPVSLSDSEAKERLFSVREAVEDGHLSTEEMVRIELPCDAIQSDAIQPNLEVIDLPGLDGTGIRERQHAEALVRAYLHRSHLVLLVEKIDGIADFISKLKNGEFFLPSSWMYWNKRFSIVITHALTPASKRKDFQDPDTQPDTQSEYLDLYREDLKWECTNHAEYSIEETQAISRLPIYALELGSLDWSSTEGADMIRSWMSNQVKELSDQIYESRSAAAQISFLISTVHVAEKEAKRTKSELEHELQAIKKKRQDKEKLLRFVERKIQNLREEKDRLESKLTSLPKSKYFLSSLKATCPQYNGRRKHSRTALIRYLKGQKARMLRNAELVVEEIQQDWNQRIQKERLRGSSLSTEQVNSIASNYKTGISFSVLRSRVESIVNDQYSSVRSQFESKLTSWIFRSKKWQRKCHIAVKKANSESISYLQEEINRYIYSLKCFYKKACYKLSQKLKHKTNTKKEYSNAIDCFKRKWNHKKALQKEKISAMNKDISKWKTLKSRLEEKAQAEIRSRMNKAKLVEHNFDALMNLFSLIQLAKELKSLDL